MASRRGRASATASPGSGVQISQPSRRACFSKSGFKGRVAHMMRAISGPAKARRVPWVRSASQVPAPTNSAPQVCLRRCDHTCASAPVTAQGPGCSGLRGPSICPRASSAHLSTTHGRPVRIACKNPRFMASARDDSTPTSTRQPAARSIEIPRPATSGLGSSTATTTRPIWCSINAKLQGPVRP